MQEWLGPAPLSPEGETEDQTVPSSGAPKDLGKTLTCEVRGQFPLGTGWAGVQGEPESPPHSVPWSVKQVAFHTSSLCFAEQINNSG